MDELSQPARHPLPRATPHRLNMSRHTLYTDTPTGSWREPCARSIPQADICFDPFHVIRLANQALDSVYTESGRQHGTPPNGRDWRRTRFALRAGAERLGEDHRHLLNQLRRTRYGLWRAWELKERLRDLYRIVEPDQAADYFRAWCRSAGLSRLRPFQNLAQFLRPHTDRIVAAVEHGLSNSRLEGINAKIRLINRRGYGPPNPHHLAAMIHLCLGGITIQLPTQTRGGVHAFDRMGEKIWPALRL